MPWTALPFSEKAKKAELASRFKVSGIPMLVILNAAGEVVDMDGRSTVMGANGDVERSTKKWGL